MRLVKVFLLSLIPLSLTACKTWDEWGGRYGYFKDESQAYQNADSLDPPVVIPQNLSANKVQNYYEVPEAEDDAEDRPTMTPPGSQLQAKTIAKAPAQNELQVSQVTALQNDKIRMAENAKIYGHTRAPSQVTKPVNFVKAWSSVGRAIQSAGYKIVERDSSMGTYYVIDTRSTGGKVRKDMPIYQVRLKAQGSGTSASVGPSNSALQSLVLSAINH